MRTKNWMLGALLTAIAIVGPVVAYAGVSVVYPGSEHTADVTANAPITFDEGADYALAEDVGFASGFTLLDSDTHFDLTLSGIGGATIIIDEYADVIATADVTSFKMEISDGLDSTGGLAGAEITSLHLRVWAGGTAPDDDADTNVCAALDLEDAEGTESDDPGVGQSACTAGTYHLQITYQLALLASGTATVSIAPSSIVLT